LAVAVAGDLLYLAGRTELLVVDISEPSDPSLMSFVTFPSNYNPAPDLAVLDGYAYLTAGSDGLHIIDVRNPFKPVRVATALSDAEHVAVSGTLAFVAHDNFLRIIDVSEPAHPLLVGQTNLTSHATDLAVSDDHVYVTVSQRLGVIDVDIPSEPVHVGSYTIPGSGHGIASGLDISGHSVYVAYGQGGLWKIDVEDPSHPNGFQLEGGQADDVAVSDGFAYVLDRWGGLLRVLRLGSWSTTGEVGSFVIDDPRDLAVAGDYVSVTSSSSGLRIVDVGTPSTPAEAGTLLSVDSPKDVAVSDGVAYVAQGNGGLGVIDVRVPTEPTVVAFLDHSPDAQMDPSGTGVRVSGDVAYLVESDCDWGCQSFFRVIDIGLPSAPTEIGSVELSGQAVDISISEGSAYLLCRGVSVSDHYGEVLYVIDIASPSDPMIADFIELPEATLAAAVSGGHAYVSISGRHSEPHRLAIIDVGTPSAPVEVGSVDVSFALDVIVRSDLVYLAAVDGLHIIDVSMPSVPVEIGFLEGPGWPNSVTVSGSSAYIATLGGIQAVDVSDPSAPTELGYCEAPSSSLCDDFPCSGIAVSRGHVFLAGGSYGLHVLSTLPCGKPYHVLDIPLWDSE
jgi:hypothetical protein